MTQSVAFVASEADDAQEALIKLTGRYPHVPPDQADVIVALGGDGFMLETLHQYLDRSVPIYGMNRGTVGFLMNSYSEVDLIKRVEKAQLTVLKPLKMTAVRVDGSTVEALAINEVSLLREKRFAAKLRISVDGRVRLPELICDGALLSTPAGSTAYNLSAHGPILPLGARLLALTPICPFRPRRWRGALLSEGVRVKFEILEAPKRPVSAVADYTEVREVSAVEVAVEPEMGLQLLFDPAHNLEERILAEQFSP
ncbi:MAG: NAD kinase [Rhodospirillaceae bacterium]|nr:NAD kinase [Rhodospirillaceae bacterium]|tara:strand:+ start:452 stop:1216 length:765 start_codon:yes stop_codon:yes gene_type:complete